MAFFSKEDTISIKENQYNRAYASEMEAIDAGKSQAKSWLTEKINSGRLVDTHEAIARQALLEIEESYQLTLF